MSKYKPTKIVKVDALSQCKEFAISALTAHQLIGFKQLMISLFSGDQQCQGKPKAFQIYRQVMTFLGGKAVSVDSAVKKIIMTQGVLSNMARKQSCDQLYLQTFENQLVHLIEKQLSGFIEQSKKREGSISKIYSYIRAMTTSKEKKKKEEDSSLNLQSRYDRKAIKEIVAKVIRPYAFYLLKIVQSYKMYANFVNGEYHEQKAPFCWKIANWCHTLGGIVKELVRLGRYFTDDFMGIELLLVYVITTDLTMFYDILQNEVERRGNAMISSDQFQLGQTSSTVEVNANEGGTNYMEVRQLIEESNLVKQSLKEIYCNSQFRQWKKLFARSECYRYEEMKGEEEESEKILCFIEKKEKEQKHSQTSQRLVKVQEQNSVHWPNSMIKKDSNLGTKLNLFEGKLQQCQTKFRQKDFHDPFQEQPMLIERLQAQFQKKSEPSVVSGEKPMFFGQNQQSSFQQFLTLSKNNKATAIRKTRLMHFNNDRELFGKMPKQSQK